MMSTDFQYPQFRSKANKFQWAIEGTRETVHRVTPDMYISLDKGPWATNTGSSGEFKMYLWLFEGTGYFDGRDSFDYLPKKGEYGINKHWWCFDQHFNISEFVKVKPLKFGDNRINLSFSYDFTHSYLVELLNNWLQRYNNGSLNEKELSWLTQYN